MDIDDCANRPPPTATHPTAPADPTRQPKVGGAAAAPPITRAAANSSTRTAAGPATIPAGAGAPATGPFPSIVIQPEALAIDDAPRQQSSSAAAAPSTAVAPGPAQPAAAPAAAAPGGVRTLSTSDNFIRVPAGYELVPISNGLFQLRPAAAAGAAAGAAHPPLPEPLAAILSKPQPLDPLNLLANGAAGAGAGVAAHPSSSGGSAPACDADQLMAAAAAIEVPPAPQPTGHTPPRRGGGRGAHAGHVAGAAAAPAEAHGQQHRRGSTQRFR